MRNTHQRRKPHRLSICIVLFISFLWPLQTGAQTISSSEAKFAAEQQLIGTTKPYSKVFIYEKNAKPIHLMKSNRDGQITFTYPFKDQQDYHIVIKVANSFHHFTITYDDQAIQDDLEIGGGFMSGENDSYMK